MNICRGCGAEITWARSKSTDRAIPLHTASKEKRAAVVSVGDDHTLEVRVVDTYIPHHALCPNADEFRKARVHS